MELTPAIREAAQALKVAGALEVYHFGSPSEGGGPDTSVDLAVRGLEWQTLHRLIGELPDRLGRPVDLVSLDEQTPFARHLERGIIRGSVARVA
jgi:predicted nucleotidyltransferase